MDLIQLKNKNITALLSPELGGNLCRVEAFSHTIIDYDESKLQKCEYTGTPILYPTPNIVENGIIHWNNQKIELRKNDKLHTGHGLVYNEAWSYKKISDESVELWIDFNKGSALFNAFPFEHRLSLTYSLVKDSVLAEYTIENFGDSSLPFGFALHPYFTKLSGEEKTYVTIPAKFIMETTEKMVSTGRLLPVANTYYDLNCCVNIGEKILDHVFTGLADGHFACINYSTLNMKIICETSAEFAFVVLYSPKGEHFFCLENQTCSTNAHNLYNAGFKKESGLLVIPPKSVHKGYIRYLIQKS